MLFSVFCLVYFCFVYLFFVCVCLCYVSRVVLCCCAMLCVGYLVFVLCMCFVVTVLLVSAFLYGAVLLCSVLGGVHCFYLLWCVCAVRECAVFLCVGVVLLS